MTKPLNTVPSSKVRKITKVDVKRTNRLRVKSTVKAGYELNKS
jgi:hypothetical protein